MYRQSEKNLLNSNIYGELWPTPTNSWDQSGSLGNPSKFQRVLPSLLHQHRSPKANWTLHDVWPPPRLVHYIYIFGALAAYRNFARCKIHFTSNPSLACVLLYWQRYCTALQQQASAKLCGVVQGMELQNFRRGRHLYSAGQPSRWASAHILVFH